MRYETGRKAATRQRILDVASRKFREEGIAAVGLASVMADAGLTNGAFYAHFDSKEDLVKEILVEALREQGEAVAALLAQDGLDGVIRNYLTPDHRQARGDGCPSAALLDEIARRPEDTRIAYTDRLLETMDMIAPHLCDADPARARVDALAIFGTLIGALQLSRAITDETLANQILERAITNAMTLAQAHTD